MSAVENTVEYLYSLKNRGIKLSLDRVCEFQKQLDYPDRSYPTFHIAGTNGKGSVTNFISAILQAGNFKVGTYTSPHISRFNERIRINGQEITDQEIVDFIDRWHSVIDELQLTFFEATTLLAMDFFRKSEVDVAVLETGLGGRLDATNIVTPLVSAITSIGMEHTEQLGDTLVKIAREKAGIIKPDVPCVIGSLDREAFAVIQKKSREQSANLIQAEKLMHPSNIELTQAGTAFDVMPDQVPYRIRMAMRGFQAVENCSIALAAVRAEDRFHIPWEGQLEAVASVTIPGRLQAVMNKPKVYYDVAHNFDSFRQLLENLRALHPNEEHQFLLGVSETKSLPPLEALFPDGQPLGIMTIPAMPLHDLHDWESSLQGCRFTNYGIGTEAVVKFCSELAREDIAVIAGSHYIGEYVFRGINFLLDSGL